ADNCPKVFNPDQANTYGDLRGDACEPAPPEPVPPPDVDVDDGNQTLVMSSGGFDYTVNVTAPMAVGPFSVRVQLTAGPVLTLDSFQSAGSVWSCDTGAGICWYLASADQGDALTPLQLHYVPRPPFSSSCTGPAPCTFLAAQLQDFDGNDIADAHDH